MKTILSVCLLALLLGTAQARKGSTAPRYELAPGETSGEIPEEELALIRSGEPEEAMAQFRETISLFVQIGIPEEFLHYEVLEEARQALQENPNLEEYLTRVLHDLPLTMENTDQRAGYIDMLGWLREPWSFRLLGEMLLDERRINYGDANPESIAAALADSVDIGSNNYEYAYTVVRRSEIFGDFRGTLPKMRRLWLANEHQLEGLLEGSAEVIVPPDDAPTSRAEQAAQSAAQPPPQPEPAAPESAVGPEPEPKPAAPAPAEPRPAPRWPWLAAAGAAALLLLGRLLRARRAQP